MEHILFSDNYKKFYEVFLDDITSATDCFEKMSRGIEFIADDLRLGRLDIRVDAVASIYDAEGCRVDYPVYCKMGDCAPTPLQFPYETTEHGHILIRMFPRKDYEWKEKEKEDIEILSRAIFFICGRARLIDLIKKAVIVDNVTGIPNLPGLYDFVRILEENGTFAGYHGICVNLKNFKFIHETLSNRRSDDILRDYARALDRFILHDEVVARIGGDSFLALIHDNRVEDFLKYISDIFVHTGADTEYIKMGARAGIYNIQPGDNIRDVMGHVDVAVSEARGLGDDYVFFDYSMTKKQHQSKEISALFPEAIAKREFEVYYQPKVNILNNTLCGCEALVRWIKKGKVVPPMDFIPVLEAEGTICTLDFYVFDQVCKTICSWIDRGIKPVRVSVNFSRIHLRNPRLAQEIMTIIDRYKIDPAYLEIELTEMSGYDNQDNLSRFINTMKDQGIHTSIDDFGTGYSSLNLLTDLNVDYVKLDKSFSKRLDSEEEKTKILLSSIVNMVHKLGFKVVAEGVETKTQVDFLKNIGCSTVQGYLYDKPLTLAEFEQRLTGEYQYK